MNLEKMRKQNARWVTLSEDIEFARNDPELGEKVDEWRIRILQKLSTKYGTRLRSGIGIHREYLIDTDKERFTIEAKLW